MNIEPQFAAMDGEELAAITIEGLAGVLLTGIRKMLLPMQETDEGIPQGTCMAAIMGDVQLEKSYKHKLNAAWDLLQDRGLLAATQRSRYPPCRLTERGRRTEWGSSETWTERPLETIAALRAQIGADLDDVVEFYLQESIRLYQDGHPVSSVFMLGVVAERVARMARDWLLLQHLQCAPKLRNATEMKTIVEAIAEALRELKKASRGTPETRAFSELVDLLATIYRTTRNKIGHPTAKPMVPMETAAVQLNAMRRSYLPAFYAAQASLPKP